MKITLIITLFLSQVSLSQIPDSIKKKAIDFQTRAWKAEEERQFERCIVLADSSITLDSTRSEPYVIKAESLWFLKRYKESAETYKKYISVDTNILRIGAYVLLGMLYDKADMFDEAKEQYLTAIRTYENGYRPLRQFVEIEEFEYVLAFGLAGSDKWKEKLGDVINKHPNAGFKNLANMTRKELLEHHFKQYGG